MDDVRLLRTQCVSGAAFGLFVAVHLANLGIAPLGAEPYNDFQRAARVVYQFPLVEVGLLVALLTHAVCAVLRLRRSGFRRANASARMRAHRYTGYFLLLVIFGHVSATRGTSLFFGVFPEFAGLSFSLWWMPLVFYPYYLLLAGCGLFHAVSGAAIALSVFGKPLPAALRSGPGFWLPTAAIAAIAAIAVLMGLGVFALGGWFFEIADPRANDYARFYADLGFVDLARP